MLSLVPRPSWSHPFLGAGHRARILLGAARFTYNSCRGDCTARRSDALPGAAAHVRSSQADCALDAARVALCFGYGSGGLPDALSSLAGISSHLFRTAFK